jgi:hypothetical protein
MQTKKSDNNPTPPEETHLVALTEKDNQIFTAKLVDMGACISGLEYILEAVYMTNPGIHEMNWGAIHSIEVLTSRIKETQEYVYEELFKLKICY